MEVSVHFWPWNPINDLLDYGAQALREYPFDQFWLVDAFQYEDPFTVLSAMASTMNVSLGTMVTFPRRNPLDLAQRFGTISHLLKPGRHIAAGIGAGGRLQESVLAEGTSPESTAVVRETLRLLRRLFAGETVGLNQFPNLSSRFNYNTESQTRLYFPPEGPLPVYLAAGGPKMFQMAAQEADGVILTSINPWTCLAGMREGRFQQAIQMVEESLTASGKRSFKKICSAKISVSEDGRAAKEMAKKQISYGVATYPGPLKGLGFDADEVEFIKSAYTQGLGIEEAARRVSDDLAARLGFVVAGTPAECIAGYEEILGHIDGLGFDHLVMGVPLGPDVSESLRLIGKKVLPALSKYLSS